MKKIILTSWIPASWKSTWAKKEVECNGAMRFSKDEIRKEDNLFPTWYFYSKENEATVVEIERWRVEDYMKINYHYIIVDNTHLWQGNKHIDYYRSLSEKYWYEFEIKEFYCSREEAIKRDSMRVESERVGEDVINKMIKIQWNNGYPKNPTFKSYNEGLSECVIVDIDWTLAFMDEKRWPYEFDKVSWDRCNYNLRFLISHIPFPKIILSWRWEECRKQTEEWLKNNHIEYNFLFMRKEWDKRWDEIVKAEIYENYIAKHHNVFAVFDDRQKVVDMWRLKYNLPTYQVWYWYF